jgi:hypothetical protein
MVVMTSGFTDAQSAAVVGILNLASPALRGMISAAISSAVKSGADVGAPLSDSAVLAAIGSALIRFSD